MAGWKVLSGSLIKKIPDTERFSEAYCSGVYCIVCTKTHQFYIGSSKHIDDRLKSHFGQLFNENHICEPLQSAFNRYSYAFTWEVLLKIEESTEYELLVWEEWFIRHYPPTLLFNKFYPVKHTQICEAGHYIDDTGYASISQFRMLEGGLSWRL